MKNLKKLSLVFYVLLLHVSTKAQVANPCGMNASNESEFYNGASPSGSVTLKPSGLENNTDSDALQTLIDNNPGKKIKLLADGSKNTFYFKDVKIKSNTHIRVGANVVLKTNRNGLNTQKNASMFSVGKTGARVSNFTFTSNGDEDDITKRFTVQLRQLTPLQKTGTITKTDALSGESFITVANAENFKIANFNIVDNYSRISTLTFSFNDAGEKNHFKSILSTSVYPEKDRTPEQGLIKNISANNGHGGYGIVQIQAGVGLLFKNLEGTGGVPLRIETGLNKAIITKDKTVDGIYGRGIKAINGLSCVDVSPHNVEQGCVDISDASSEGTVFTVRLDKGFEDDKDIKVSDINSALMSKNSFNNLVTNKQFEKFGNNGNSLGFFVKIADINTYKGTFANVKLKQIQGKGGNDAQVKSKFYKFYDQATKTILAAKQTDGTINDDMETVSGKTLAVIKYSADPSIDGCNCGGKSPSENGCFGVKIAKTNNSYVNLRRGGNGISTSGIAKILIDSPNAFYKLSDHTPTSAPGWTNAKRPSLISEKSLDGLFGATVSPCDTASPQIEQHKEFLSNNPVKITHTVTPNPTSGIVNVVTSIGAKIEVYNSSGSLLLTIPSTELPSTSIPLNRHVSGMYFIKIYQADKVIVKKVLKK
ncbi:T9SS type A sorting domain-containing protein [Ochrovirga pacifica]|uniref:T9SS type A sorting domain-containing protein n=1 Tax=Ochrovirga pacifica TaxID=1042376 RepID=UPI0002559B2E|nr:T9SS type A sorting domain-containing protein [Ochrovirga pacifica]